MKIVSKTGCAEHQQRHWALWQKRSTLFTLSMLSTTAMADLQVVLSNSVSEPVLSSSNIVVMNFSSAGYREDTLPRRSIIASEKTGERVLLDHFRRTYARQTLTAETNVSAAGPVALPTGEASIIAGCPVEAYRWTNGTTLGCLWIAPAAAVPRTVANTDPRFQTSGAPSPGLMPGSRIEGDRILLCSQYSAILPPPSASSVGASAPLEGQTNLLFTLTSTFLSMTETNFPPSEFEIPPGYRDVTGETNQFKVNMSAFGYRVTGEHNLEALRNNLKAGKSIFHGPPPKPGRN
jgi:hypothetical protein